MTGLLKQALQNSPLYPIAKTIYRHTLKREYLATRAQLEAFYRSIVKPDALVFDVGANHGDFVDAYLHLGARVVAVEPHPECAAELHALYGRRRGFHLVQAALGAQPGEVQLFLGENGMDNVSTVSEDYRREAAKIPGLAVAGWTRSVAVKQDTLDALISAFGMPDFCKIDVEGYEIEVLKGLRRPLPHLQFEYQPWAIEKAVECARYLDNLGMRRFNATFAAGRADVPALLPEWQNLHGMIGLLRDASSRHLVGDVFAKQ